MYVYMQAFNYLDSDGDGYLTMADLQKHGRKLGLKAADLQGMLVEADKDGDGKISEDEFLTTMRNTNLFRQS